MCSKAVLCLLVLASYVLVINGRGLRTKALRYEDSLLGLEEAQRGVDYHNNHFQLEREDLDEGAVPVIKELGCYKDNGLDRALRKYYKSMWGHTTSEIIAGCAKDAVVNGYLYFGIQNGVECWGDKEGHIRFDKYGKADNCKDNLGSNWSNFVYKIEKADGYCITHSALHKIRDTDECKSCECQSDGTVVCHHKVCPSQPHHCEKKTSSKCCGDVCACFHNNIHYNNGETWTWYFPDNKGCEQCVCTDDHPVCKINTCPGCSKYVDHVPGQCCRACATDEPPTFIIVPTTKPVFTLPRPPGFRKK